MKQSEIDFCEIWRSVARDGCMDARALWSHLDKRGEYSPPGGLHNHHHYPMHLRHEGDGPQGYYSLTPHGADLVASYEAALEQGLDIVDDEGQRPDYGNEPPFVHEVLGLVDCPDCEDGTIGIPVAYGANGGVLQVWPATCPRCNGARKAEVLADLGRPIEGLGQILDESLRVLVGTDERPWQKLTAELSKELEGQTVEVRNSGMGKIRRLSGVYRVGMLDHSPWFTSIHDPRTGERVDGIPPSWHVRVADEPNATDPRATEWHQLTRAVAKDLVGKRFDVRGKLGTAGHSVRGKELHTRLHLDCGNTLRLDGRWWVRVAQKEKDSNV